jgi:hypothetical protein
MRRSHLAELAVWHEALDVAVLHHDATPVHAGNHCVDGDVLLLQLPDPLPEHGGLRNGNGVSGTCNLAREYLLQPLAYIGIAALALSAAMLLVEAAGLPTAMPCSPPVLQGSG